MGFFFYAVLLVKPLVLWLAVDLLHGFCGVFLTGGFVSGDEACAVW